MNYKEYEPFISPDGSSGFLSSGRLFSISLAEIVNCANEFDKTFNIAS